MSPKFLSDLSDQASPAAVRFGGTFSPAITTLKKVSSAAATVIFLSIAAMLFLLFYAVGRHDELAAEDSVRQFNSLLDLQSRQLATQALDYSNWDEAIDAVLVVRDGSWWAENAGDYAVKMFNLSFSIVVDGENTVVFSAQTDDQLADPSVFTSEPSLIALLSAARSRPIEGTANQVAATGLVRVHGQVHSVAAVRFRPESQDSKPNPDPQALLLFARSFVHGILPVTGEVMGLSDLRLTSGPQVERVALNLTLVDGEPAGTASWPSPRAGQKMLVSMLPWIGSLLLLVAVTVIYAVFRTRRLAQEILVETRLRESLAEHKRSILDSTGEGIVGLNAQGRISFANRAAEQILRRTNLALVDTELHRILPPQTSTTILGAITQGRSWSSPSEVLSDSTGRLFSAELSIRAIYRREAVEGAVLVFRDITDRKLIEDQIYHRANFDTLTGAPNRNLLLERLANEIGRARESSTSGAVMLIDIDRFKKVNDSMGHEAGDLLLKQVYERLRGCVDITDTVARLGGDEFALVLPNIGSPESAAQLANSVLDALSQGFDLHGHSVWAGGSLGIAFYPSDGDTPTELLRQAEMAMYKAKEEGRNSLQFYRRSMDERIQARRALEVHLRQALAQQQLLLYYQPILDLKSERLSHLEALVRWRHPERGLVTPDAFIPLAEETGLIADIGTWVLDEGCRQLAAWHAQGLDPSVGIAINVSGSQVPGGLPVDCVAASLTRHGVAGHLLNFEITESVLFDRSPAVMDWLADIRGLGIHLMIDDFGTGYSSLSYLKHIRAGTLKIDKSFIAGVADNVEDQSLVRAILAMAHSLNLQVVAEGVETLEQVEWLREHDCDFVQGYLYGRPVPADGTLPSSGGSIETLDESPK